MVKKFGLHHLTVSDLAAAPSHSLHRTPAALPGPGSAHHVALSSPRRRRSPGARCVGSCWLRLEVVLPGEDHPQLRLAGVHHDRDRLRQRCRGWVRGAGKRHGRTATERRRRASGRPAGSVNPCRPAVYHSRSEHSRRGAADHHTVSAQPGPQITEPHASPAASSSHRSSTPTPRSTPTADPSPFDSTRDTRTGPTRVAEHQHARRPNPASEPTNTPPASAVTAKERDRTQPATPPPLPPGHHSALTAGSASPGTRPIFPSPQFV
jgi:hypothetical protein